MRAVTVNLTINSKEKKNDNVKFGCEASKLESNRNWCVAPISIGFFFAIFWILARSAKI